MDYGHFDDNLNEYVINTPLTPRPWENRLWNNKLNAQITNHGTGIVYERDPEGRFILYNWSNHRYLYVYDKTDKVLWCPSWYPANVEIDSYECRHGLKYTVIKGSKGGIEVTWKTTVHPEDSTEIWQVEIRNISGKCKDLILIPFYQVDISFKDPYWGTMNLFKGHFSEKANCLYIKNYSHRRDLERYALAYHSDLPITKYELDSGAFLKGFSPFSRPKTVTADEFTNSSPDRQPPAFAIGYDIRLEANEIKFLNAEIFSSDSFEDAQKQSLAYSGKNLYETSLSKHLENNKKLLLENRISTGDASFDRFINVWLKHQLHYNADWNRGWDLGFRDCMQDSDSWRRHQPELTRERILAAARHVYADGHTVRKWAKLDTKLYFDGGVWFVNTIVDYIMETGDMPILETQIPYLDGGADSILGHMKRAMDFLDKQRGPGGICRMGYGDWNDALNGIDRKGKGESVWTTMAFIWSLNTFITLLEKVKDADSVKYRKIADELAVLLNEKYFEGDRYIRAVTDEGLKVGSKENDGGSIYLNTQAWAMISGIANPERTQAIVASVRKNLYTPWGPVLLAPPYTKYREDIGRISADNPGTVENGSNYVHAAMFYAYGLTLSGMGDEALKIIQQVLPSNPDNPPEQSQLEPYNISNSYEGLQSTHPGRAMFAWRTGSVAWLLKVIWDGMLGIVPSYDGVRIQVRLPNQWRKNGIEASRKIRGKNITFIFKPSQDRVENSVPVRNNSTIPYDEILKHSRFHIGL
jgi:cellobiose phosphorylase